MVVRIDHDYLEQIVEILRSIHRLQLDESCRPCRYHRADGRWQIDVGLQLYGFACEGESEIESFSVEKKPVCSVTTAHANSVQVNTSSMGQFTPCLMT